MTEFSFPLSNQCKFESSLQRVLSLYYSSLIKEANNQNKMKDLEDDKVIKRKYSCNIIVGDIKYTLEVKFHPLTLTKYGQEKGVVIFVKTRLRQK